jgi:hypothetical protein
VFIFLVFFIFLFGFCHFRIHFINFLSTWVACWNGDSSFFFFFLGYDLGWIDGIHVSFQSGVWAVGHFISRGLFFFLSMEFVSTFILASLSLSISDGSNLGLDTIGTSGTDGKDGNRAAFSLLLFSIV